MNNKGFTVVELLASFTLTMVITVFLFEIVMELKNVYTSSAIESEVKNTNALIARALNECVLEKGLDEAKASGTTNQATGIDIIDICGQKFSMPEDTKVESFSEAKVNAVFGYYGISYVVTSTELDEDIPFSVVVS